MQRNYTNSYNNIYQRLNPDNEPLEDLLKAELSSISYSEVLVYIRLAMKSVGPNYTKRTIEAGNRVKDHLNRELDDVTFKYQGSVMTDTHIKGHSDIDLLTISDKFFNWSSVEISRVLNSWERKRDFTSSSIERLERVYNASPYKGRSLEDLKKLRYDSEKILNSIYDVCDTTKPKSIKITNKSLRRDVDIVVANWYDDVASIVNDRGEYRGVQIYDKVKNEKGAADYPFLSIKRINQKNSETKGRLKKMIRFLKNIKADSLKNIKLTSFDLNAICYDIGVNKYSGLAFYKLVPVIFDQLISLCNNSNNANRLMSVDGKEPIFRNSPEKLESLRSLLMELRPIFDDFQKTEIK